MEDRNHEFYVPMCEWDDIYPPDEYCGTSVDVDEAEHYALEHFDEIDATAYLDWYYGGEESGTRDIKRAYGDASAMVEFFFDGWLKVTYDQMCPRMEDYYNPHDPSEVGISNRDFI